MSNRDYVYEIQKKELTTKDGNRLWAIFGDSVKDPQILAKATHEKGVVSIDNYAQKIVIADDGANGSKVLMDYFDDPKVALTGTGAFVLCSIFWLIRHF
jgi:hypothetical protein